MLALHDLLGKALGVPVCNLIGGSGRRQVLAVIEVAPGAADGMARQCAEWVEQGVRGFKAKVGAIPEDDVERLAAIRVAVGPEIMLRAGRQPGLHAEGGDSGCGRMCERRDLGLELLEQPVPKWDLAGMAQVRAAVDVLIEADEAAYTPHDVVQIVRAQARRRDQHQDRQGGRPVPVQEDRGGRRSRRPGVRDRHGMGPRRQGRRQAAPGSGHPLAARRRRVHRTDAARDLLLAGPQAADLAPPLSDGYLNVPLGPGLGVTVDEQKMRAHELPKHH